MDAKIKSYTYYLPHKFDARAPLPNIAVVLLIQGTKIARGVAITSELDQFNRKLGRAIALGRATKAFNEEHSCENNKVRRPWVKQEIEFKNKCSYMPTLTDYEKCLIDEPLIP